MDKEASTASSGSLGSQHESSEPLSTTTTRRAEPTVFMSRSSVPGIRQSGDGTSIGAQSTAVGYLASGLGASPSASVCSTASHDEPAGTETSTSPQAQAISRQLPFVHGVAGSQPTAGVSTLPPIIAFESQDVKATRISALHGLATSPDDSIELPNLRRSHHVPASFLHHGSTTSSNSTSKSSNLSNPSVFESASSEEAFYRLPPISAMELAPPDPSNSRDGNLNPGYRVTSGHPTIASQQHTASASEATNAGMSRTKTIDRFNLTGQLTASQPLALSHQRTTFSGHGPHDASAKLSLSKPGYSASEYQPSPGEISAYEVPDSNADPLSVLAYAGRMVDRGGHGSP